MNPHSRVIKTRLSTIKNTSNIAQNDLSIKNQLKLNIVFLVVLLKIQTMNLIYLTETMTVYSIYYKSVLFLLFLLTYVHFPLILKILGGTKFL